MRFIIFSLLFFLIFCFAVHAQDNSLSRTGGSANKVNRQQFMSDSIAMRYLMPDPLRENQSVSKLLQNNLADINTLASISSKSKNILKSGQIRKVRDPWVISAIIGLLIYTALLNLFFSRDVRSVIHSFYNKNALSQIDKEGGLINSWAFIGLFVLFSMAFGLVLYQLTAYYNVYYNINRSRLFISFSVIIIFLFAIKFLVLKFISFVFDITRPVSQYIAILNLTYFNIAFVLLAVDICFSLLANQYIPLLLIITLLIIAVIFAWQFLRNSVNIISNFRFHKFYLFIYLCALEICPVLILIKALNI